MKKRLQLIFAALALAIGTLAPTVGSAQSDPTSFPNCWHGAWSGWTSGAGSQTCTNSVFSVPLYGRVQNQVAYGPSHWEQAVMSRIAPNCGVGNTILWINSMEFDFPTGTYVNWWWRSVNTQPGCSFQLVRNARPDNHVIFSSRCRLETCNTAH